jgi:hypothetical protein
MTRNAGASNRTLLTGIIAPFAAAGLGLFTYRTLTQASSDRDADFVFRLSTTAVAMAKARRTIMPSQGRTPEWLATMRPGPVAGTASTPAVSTRHQTV